MTSRKVHQAPTFVRVDEGQEIKRIILELQRLTHPAEVTLENHPSVAKGKIIEWNEAKKLFTVEWSELTREFFLKSGEKTGIRAFFKVNLVSFPVLFKCELVRRLPDETFQYRTPVQFFKNQRRAALRVPLEPGAGKLKTHHGTFPVLDLSTSGARVAIPESLSRSIHVLDGCSLILSGKKIQSPDFGVRITTRLKESAGCRFHGLNEALHIEIKQFLMEALHDFFQKVKKK
ncbi:MAG: hypothetical protein KGP28_03980 [Bdellovibrionales bacterium]|nr:hypothetical protein [Bdellovibrionales bacterium]